MTAATTVRAIEHDREAIAQCVTYLDEDTRNPDRPALGRYLFYIGGDRFPADVRAGDYCRVPSRP